MRAQESGLRVAFVTHNELGLACLEELKVLGAQIELVITRPKDESIADQTELSTFTDSHGIQLRREESVNTPSVKEAIAQTNPDLLFVVGWSRLVDKEVIDIPSIACLGMHPAPLPRGRGRAPLAWSIIKGLDETKLTMFHLVEEADAGDIVGQEPIKIDINDDANTIYNKMVEAGRYLIQTYYPVFEKGEVPRTEQDDSKATWWPKRDPRHGLIDWTRTPKELYDWVRGQTRPYPGAFSYLDGTKIRVWAANPPLGEISFVKPGEIKYRDGDALGVGAWEGIIELTEVQVSDDDPITAGELVDRYHFEVGDVFENVRNRVE